MRCCQVPTSPDAPTPWENLPNLHLDSRLPKASEDYSERPLGPLSVGQREPSLSSLVQPPKRQRSIFVGSGIWNLLLPRSSITSLVLAVLYLTPFLCRPLAKDGRKSMPSSRSNADALSFVPKPSTPTSSLNISIRKSISSRSASARSSGR